MTVFTGLFERLISMVENLLIASKIQSSTEKLVYKSVDKNEISKRIHNIIKSY